MEGEFVLDNYAIEVKDLSKRFGNFEAVKGIDFTVKTGEIFGFLGPNGAGKTTTINMLTGLAKSSSGFIRIAGENRITSHKKIQKLIGIVPDESNLYEEMNGLDNLMFCASLYGMNKANREARAKQLLLQFGLADTGKKPFKSYSKGMKRKLTIAAGIIHEPKILFLDEPTTGIDVESARQIRKLIKGLNDSGTTIFLTTHYIEEAERLCHRIGFIVDGKIACVGKVEELMRDAQKEHTIEFKLEKDISSLRETLIHAFPTIQINNTHNYKLRISSQERIDLMPFIKLFEEKEVQVYEAKIIQPTLEDIFVKITGIGAETMRKEKEGRKG